MIRAALIAETVLDRGVFMPAAQEVTGKNHVSPVDAKHGMTRVVQDLEILRDFHGDFNCTVEEAITHITFMVAGFSEDIEEFIVYTRGMPHFDTTRVNKMGLRCIVITGSLDQWKLATIAGCRAPEVSPVRHGFNRVYDCLIQKGLSRLFEGYQTVQRGQGTFLLERR